MNRPRRFRLVWRTWTAASLAAVMSAALAFYGLRWYEYSVTFHPEQYTPGEAWNLPEGAEDVWFESEGNLRLHGWFIRSQHKPPSGAIIYFHGNSGNATNVGWLGKHLATRGFDVLVFDYRGYGRSEGEIDDESDLYADGRAAYHYMVNARGVSPTELVLYGQSLGTAVVTSLASEQSCAAIILESGFSSANSAAATMLPWLPRWLHLLGKNRFDSARKLANVHCPVLITHGDPDHTIPIEESHALYSAASEPKRLLIVPGADHNVSGFGGNEYLDEVAAFAREAILSRGKLVALRQVRLMFLVEKFWRYRAQG